LENVGKVAIINILIFLKLSDSCGIKKSSAEADDLDGNLKTLTVAMQIFD